MHLIDRSVNFMGTSAIVGNSIPIGVGLALSSKLRGDNEISVVYLGDGAVEEGVFYEAANFAVVKNLPVLFVCENNLYSVYTPLKTRQPKQRKITKLASAIGLEANAVDGYAIDECHSVISRLVNYVRAGNGPAFIEASTYRFREHCGPNFDNDIGYRTIEEYQIWRDRDPCLL